MGCNRCLNPIEGLKTTQKHRHTHANQTFLFHLGTLCNQSLPKPSNLHELWPGLHQASANSELACRRHKDKWPYQCKVRNDWQVCGVWGVCVVRHMWWPLISRSEMKGLICGCSVIRNLTSSWERKQVSLLQL